MAGAIGVSRGSISNWERGEAQPSLGNAVALAQATGVTLEWLADGVAPVNEKAPIREDEGQLCAPRDLNPEPADYGSALGDGFDSINLPSIPNTADALLALIPERVR